MDLRTWMSAAEGGDAGALSALLAAGAGVDASTPNGETALLRAAAKGHAEVVRLLLDAGADVNRARQDRMTALTLAAFFGHAEAVRLLVARGADTSARDQRGLTALNWASSRGNVEVVRLLKEVTPTEDAPERRRVVEGSLRPHDTSETRAPQRPPVGRDANDSQPAAATEKAEALSADGASTEITSHEVTLNGSAAVEVEAVFGASAGKHAERGRRHQRVEFLRERARERERQRARRPAPPAAALQPSNVTHSPATAAPETTTTEHAERSAKARAATRPNYRRASRVVALAAAVVLLLTGGALFYRYARRPPAPPAQPVEVVQPPTRVEELPQPAPSPTDTQGVIVAQPDGQYVDPNATAGSLPTFPTNVTSAPTDLTVVPAPRASAPSAPARSHGVAGDEPTVVELANPEQQQPADPRRGNAARPERREERAAAPQTPAEPAPRRDTNNTPPLPRAAEDDSLPSSMIAPKPSATPKKKVIQWP